MHPTRVLGAVLLVVTLPLMLSLGALGALGYEKAGRFDSISEWDPSRSQPSYEVRGEKAVSYWAHAGDAFPLAQVFAPTAHSFAFRPVERLQQSLADEQAPRQYAQGLARLVGPSLGGKPLTVSLSAGYLVAMIVAGGVTMGLGALVLWFNVRHWPALIDPEGITDRAGRRYRWSELQTLRRVIVKSRGGGEVGRRVELTFPQGRVHLAPNGLQRSRELSDVFVLLFPPQLRR